MRRLLFLLLSTGCSTIAGNDQDSGPGAHDNEVISDDTLWKAADGPHVIRNGALTVKGGTLTIEPCTEVVFEGSGILVSGEGSKLLAHGTADCPITFRRSGELGFDTVIATNAGTADLEHAQLIGLGGDGSFYPGAITVQRDEADNNYALLHAETLRLQHVRIEGGGIHGVALLGNGTFSADSEDLVITGMTAQPVSFEVRNLVRLPSGAYTGNGTDELLIQTLAHPVVPMHLVNRGLPYRVTNFGSSSTTWVFVGDNDDHTTTLTIDPGVTLLMDPNTGITIASGSALDARGTTASPIVIKSSDPSQGWHGLFYGGVGTRLMADANRISHARIEDAGTPFGAGTSTWCHCTDEGGQACNEYAAIIFDDQPTSAFITDTVISNSAGHGLDHGYLGTQVEFPSVTFENIANCQQTTPKAADDTCTGDVTCP